MLYFSDDVKIRDYEHIYVYEVENGQPVGKPVESYDANEVLWKVTVCLNADGTRYLSHDTRSSITTIPFVKNNEFDYEWLVAWAPKNARGWVFPVIYILIIITIITAVSNGANLTDGLDGLAAGTSSIIVFYITDIFIRSR